MDSLLGFKNPLLDAIIEEKPHGFKLVPWVSWDEWKFVRQLLFCSVSDSVTLALQRITTWRSRGCVPEVIEVTANIVEIQQKDPFFRNGLNESFSLSNELLVLLYSMVIIRLVNGVVENTRKKNEVSIGEAADAIGIPRMLIDIRHECSHRGIPSLQLLRLASVKALDWLVSYYWEPQERTIPLQKDKAANLRKEIKRRLREVVFCLKAKQMAKSSSSHIKGKRVRQTETLCGRNKFLFHVAGKLSQSNTAGPKKQLAKALRNILRLYASSSAEVVYILLEYLVNALDSSNLVEQPDDNSMETKQSPLDHCKSVVLKLSSKEPEILLLLAQALTEKLETDEALDYQIDGIQSSENAGISHRVELLSCLFQWIIEHLKTQQKEFLDIKVSKTVNHLSKETILSLLRRCLMLSSSNKHLLSSAVTLAQMTGDNTMLHKVKKLSLLNLANSETESVESCDVSLLSGKEYCFSEAEKKLELLKLHRMESKQGKSKQSKSGHSRKWAVVKSWNPCPIGMLPSTIGFSGQLPVLDSEEVATISLNQGSSQCGKREAERGIEEMDHTSTKKIKESEAGYATIKQSGMDVQGIKSHMLIDGVWKKVSSAELLALSSAIRMSRIQVLPMQGSFQVS